MANGISSGLKTTLLLHALVGLILGILYLLVPVAWGEAISWPAAQPFDQRVIGAAFLAFALASWLAYREAEWSKVRIVVQMHMTFTILATLLLIWGMISLPMPPLGWGYVILVGAFAVAFTTFFTKHGRS